MKQAWRGLALVLAGTAVAGSAWAGAGAYVKFVKPIDQESIDHNPHKKQTKGKKKGDPRLEGCGPVAMASLLGYWATERGYAGLMHSGDNFDGSAHPTKTIYELYQIGNAHKVPGKSTMSYTLPAGVKKGLEEKVEAANKKNKGKPRLKVERDTSLKSWSKRREQLQKNLRNGWPTILLFKNIPAGLSGKNKKESFKWHYVVAVGYDDPKDDLYVLTGWVELPKSTSTGPEVHRRVTASGADWAHASLTYAELKKTHFGMIWIEGGKKSSESGASKGKAKSRKRSKR